MKNKFIVATITAVLLFQTSFGQDYFLPSNHKLPPKDEFIRLYPMKIKEFRNKGLGISYIDDQLIKNNYYGILEVGEKFCQYSIYDRDNNLILKRLGDSEKDSFVKDYNESDINNSKFNLVSLTRSVPHTTCYIQLKGNNDFPNLFEQSVTFQYWLSSSNGNIVDIIEMKYVYDKK